MSTDQNRILSDWAAGTQPRGVGRRCRTMVVRGLLMATVISISATSVSAVAAGTPASPPSSRARGSGGNAPTPPNVEGPAASLLGAQGSPTPQSFWVAATDGVVWNYGLPPLGSPADGGPLAAPLVGMKATSDARGYWAVASDGGVFTYGDANFFGSTGSIHLNRPVVALAPTTPDGKGYWLVASDGGVFSFGDAQFYGSTGSILLAQPIVGLAPTPDGRGYWLVASDGGIFAFGDAQFYGSMGGQSLSQPVVAMASTPDGKGYWLVASDGGIFAFGDAQFYGSTGGGSGEPAEEIVPTTDGAGYWIIDQNGTSWAFGDAGPNPPPQALLMRPTTAGDKAVLWAFTQLGKPYIYGGNGPAGYDCSGLALAAWRNADGMTFARVADDQFHTAGSVAASGQIQAGDLVFWGTSPTDWTTVYHTAIYVGGGQIVESTGNEVQINQLDQWGTDQVMPNARRP